MFVISRKQYTVLNSLRGHGTPQSRIFLSTLASKKSLPYTLVFILQMGTKFVYILIYVDDIFITGMYMYVMSRVTDLLTANFSLKDFGEL